MTESKIDLKPIGASELANLLLEQSKEIIQTNQPFLRNIPANMRGSRSLYGQILHSRGVADEQLAEMSEKEAQQLSLSGVALATRYKRLLIDFAWERTSVTRPDLVLGRFVASLVNPHLLLGHMQN